MKPSTNLILLPAVIVIVATRSLTLAAEAPSAPIVIAHRGASGYLPEHTLPAVAVAHALGADYIEQDIVLTKDHEPLVIHDLILDNVTNVREAFPDRHRSDGHYYVADFTLAEIRSLRVHERIDPRTQQLALSKRFPLGTVNFSLATLAEHIELIKGLNQTHGRDVGLLVELKEPTRQLLDGHDMCRIVLETLAGYGYRSRADRAIIQSFDLVAIRRLRNELHTDLRLVQLLNDKTLGLPPNASRKQISDAFTDLAGYATGIGPSLDMLLSSNNDGRAPQVNDWIKIAHQAGLTVYAYTFRWDSLPKGFTDFTSLVQLFSDADVDGFIADHPDKLRAALTIGLR